MQRGLITNFLYFFSLKSGGLIIGVVSIVFSLVILGGISSDFFKKGFQFIFKIYLGYSYALYETVNNYTGEQDSNDIFNSLTYASENLIRLI